MTPRDKHSLLDIWDAGKLIGRFIGEVASAEQLKSNSLISSAVAWQIHIIGEATKRISDEGRDLHPSIPWRQMARIRDRIVHGYDEIDWDIVCQVATSDLPPVVAEIERILRGLGVAPRL